jgi:hypothetical protein
MGPDTRTGRSEFPQARIPFIARIVGIFFPPRSAEAVVFVGAEELFGVPVGVGSGLAAV